MSGKQDLVVKMTINSQDFDAGLRNAKSEMNRFQSQTASASTFFKSTMKGMASAFTALGVAVAAKDMFNSFMHSTQAMGDKWDNTMAACKTSWQSFQTEIMLNGGAAVSKLSDMYKEAKKLADLMDDYGSSQISQEYANMRYETIISNAMTQYRDAKKAGNKAQMEDAYNTANTALNEYVAETNKSIDVAMKAAIQHAKTIGVADINENNFWSKFDDLYLRINRGELSANAQVFQQYANMSNRQFRNEVWAKEHPTYMTGKYGVDMPENPIARGTYAMKVAGYSEQAIKAAEAEYRQSQVIDEKLNSQLELLKNYGDLNQRLNSWKRKVIQMAEGETTTTTTTPTTGGLTWEQQMEAMIRQMQRVPINRDVIIPLEELIEYEDIIEEDTDAVIEAWKARQEAMAALNEEVKMGIQTFAAFGSILGSIGTLADDDMFARLGQSLSSIASQASSTISTLMALSGAQTIEGITETFSSAPPFTKIAMTATALAGILGMVATAKSAFAGSYANGGVVPGTSYSGDKLWARVNSGEVILNRSQQAALASGGGTVKFVIEGSQLKGVLDNYESIENM